MVENNFELIILKEDLKKVHEIIKSYDFDFPVFFIDLDSTIKIQFTSDYEEYELFTDIKNSFKGHELKEKLGPGKNTIRLTMHRYQSPYSIDGWGRPIENPLDETFFLVKMSASSDQKPQPNPEIIVSYKQEIQAYFINLIMAEEDGIKGFRLLEDFENNLYGKDHSTAAFGRFHRRLMDCYSNGLWSLKDYVAAKIKESRKSSRRIPKSTSNISQTKKNK